MTTSQPVLDYAPASQPRSASTLAARALVVLACGLILAALAYIDQPRHFRSLGYLLVPPADSVTAVTNSQTSAVAIMRSSAPAIAATLSARGTAITAQQLAEGLKVEAIPESQLVAVVFESDDPQRSAIVANAIINSFLSSYPTASLATPAAMPLTPRRNIAYPIVGFVIGCGLGSLVLRLDWRIRKRRANFIA